MGDLLYLFGTTGFFLLMLGYLAACAAVGRRASSEAPAHDD